MISLQKKFLFVHVPKTGGNSIQNILKDYSEDKLTTLAKHQDGIERFGVRNDTYNITKHSTLSHYKSVLDPKTYSTLFKFATIRNPWDRMISCYFSPHRGITDWNRTSFLELVNRKPTLRYYITEYSFFEKVVRKLGIPIKITKKNLDSDIDFLIRFENIDDDFELLCEKLDIPYSSLPKRNKSNRNHYSHYYDEELKEIVRTKFIDEITYGNYDFKSA